jgi:hypothetical protein
MEKMMVLMMMTWRCHFSKTWFMNQQGQQMGENRRAYNSQEENSQREFQR